MKLLINRQSGEAVAMKMVDLKKHPDAAVSVKKEVCIQKILQHPNILKFFGKRTQGDVEYIFLEYAAGGELFDRIGESFINIGFLLRCLFACLLGDAQKLIDFSSFLSFFLLESWNSMFV